MMNSNMHNEMVNAICFLAVDAIEQSQSGHRGMSGFGASAPADKLYKHLGITTANFVKTAELQAA